MPLSDSLLLPILGRAFNSPDIPGLIQGKSQEPKVFELSERDAVDHAGRNLSARRQTFEVNGSSRGHGTRGTHGAPAQIGKDDLARLREGIAGIKASESHGNLAGDASASPRNFFRP
jgi:hypothetical protein